MFCRKIARRATERRRASGGLASMLAYDRISRWTEHALRKHFWVLLAYIALSLVLTWPLAAHFATHVPGDGIDDPSLAWNLWWAKHALVDHPQNPFLVDWQFWPVGINLAFYTLTVLNGMLGIPLQVVFGVIPTYNLLLLSSFASQRLRRVSAVPGFRRPKTKDERPRTRGFRPWSFVLRRRVHRRCAVRVRVGQAVLRSAGTGQHRQLAMGAVRGALHRAGDAPPGSIARCGARRPVHRAPGLCRADLCVVPGDLRRVGGVVSDCGFRISDLARKA